VRLVEDQHEAVPGLLEPRLRLLEERPLEGTHEHVLKHRVVRHEDVGRVAVVGLRVVDRLVPGHDLTVVGAGEQALLPVVIGVGLPLLLARLVDLLDGLVLREECLEVLRGVATEAFELELQVRGEVEVVLHQVADVGVALRAPGTGVLGSPGVHPEHRVTPAA
jgi:hypothetical protein